MALKIEDVAQYLGRPVFDIYRRKVGTLVGVYSEVDGTVTALEIMVSDDKYETISAERFELTQEGLRLVPEWVIEAKKVERKLDTVRKRLKAAEELYKKGQIPENVYKEYKNVLIKEYEKVRREAQELKEKLRRKILEIENFVLHLDKAITHLMVSYTAGEIPEQGFKNSIDLLKLSRQAAIDEKKDVEKHLAIIERLESEAASLSVEESKAPAAVSGGPMVVKVVSGSG